MTRILIVEPVTKDGIFLSNFFARKKWFIKIAESALQAHYLFHKNDFDVVIINYELPDMSGLQLITNMLQNKKKALFVITSEYKFNALIKQGSKKGIMFLKKPFELEEIKNILNEYHEKNNLLQEQFED